MKTTRHISTLFGLAIVLSCYVERTQAQELQEAAREPFNRGMAAVRIQDWELANRYFLEAFNKDRAPPILFNLGLVSTKLPGHELRAIAWFKSYLYRNPDAANARAVKDQIVALDVKLESVAGKLVSELAATRSIIMSGVKEKNCERYDEECNRAQIAFHRITSNRVWRLARLQALLGRTRAARQALSLYNFDGSKAASAKPRPFYTYEAFVAASVNDDRWAELAVAFARSGDLDMAKNVVQRRIRDAGKKAEATSAIMAKASVVVAISDYDYLVFAEKGETLLGEYDAFSYHSGKDERLVMGSLRSLGFPSASYNDTQLQKFFAELASAKVHPDLAFGATLYVLERFVELWKKKLQ